MRNADQRAAAAPMSALMPALVIAAMGLWAALLVIVAFSADRLYALALIAATLLPVALSAVRNTRLFLLVGMVFTAILGLSINFDRRVHVGGAPSFSIDAVDFFIVPLLVFLARDLLFGYRRGLRVPAVSLWWLALAALGFVSMLAGPYRMLPLFEMVRMLKCWLLFVVVVNECVRERHFQYVLAALSAGLAMNIAIALLQYTLERGIGLEALGEPANDTVTGSNHGVFLSTTGVYRVSGLVGHPNLFGAYLAMLIPLFLAALFTDHRRRVRAALAILSVVATGVLLLTLSRTAWAAFAAAMTVLSAALLVHPALRGRYPTLKVTMLALFAVGAVVAAPLVILRFTGSDPGALDFRRQWVDVAFSMVQAKPIFGFGLNGFSFHIVGYTPYSTARLTEIFGPIWPVVHNLYMLVWAEQGTVGLLALVAFKLHLLWLAVKNLRYRVSERIFMVSVGTLSALVAMIVDGFGSFYLKVPAPSRIFWVIAGLIVAAAYWNRANVGLRTFDRRQTSAPPWI